MIAAMVAAVVASILTLTSPTHPHHCTPAHWRSSLHHAERWIDFRESRLEPRVVEPTTGAMGLGQLLPSTYRSLHLKPVLRACPEIQAQRAYMHERYGSWRAAKAWWEVHSWW